MRAGRPCCTVRASLERETVYNLSQDTLISGPAMVYRGVVPAMERRLRKPPLLEALLELRWGLVQEQPGSPPLDPGYPVVVGLLYDRVKSDLPFIEDLPQSRLPPEVLQWVVTHRFRRAAGQWPLIQIGPGIASVNFVQDYAWGAFEPEALRLIQALTAAFQLAASRELPFEKALLRYINAFEVATIGDGALFFLRDSLHVKLELPPPGKSGTGAPERFRLETSFGLEVPKGLAILGAAVGQREGKAALFLDLSVQSSGRDIRFPEGFQAWLESAHRVVEDWFFTLIAGPLENRLQEED